MTSLGTWALPRHTPTSDSRNKQQQQMSYGQDAQQQEPSRQSSQVQSLNRSIYSVSEPSRKTPQTAYNGLIVDPTVQEVSQSIPPRTSHYFEQHPVRGQTHASTPLGSNQPSLGNGQLTHVDQNQASRVQQSQQAGHDSLRQAQASGQDMMMQGMAMAGSHASPIDHTRHSLTNGMVSGTIRQTSAQHYPQYQQLQQSQQLQQPPFNQTPWNQANSVRRPSNDTSQGQPDRRSGVAYVPAVVRTDVNYPIPAADGRQQTSRSSVQAHGQSVVGTSPVNAFNNMTQSEHSGSHTGTSSAPISGGDAASTPQWHLSQLSTRIDQLAKTQADMLAYLHVELTRRKEWEDQLLKELRQRREQVSAVAAPQDARWSGMGRSGFTGNPMDIAGGVSYPSGTAGSNPNHQNGYSNWPQAQNPAQNPSNGNQRVFVGQAPSDASKVAADSASFFQGQAAQSIHSRDRHMPMNGNLVDGFLQIQGQNQEQGDATMTAITMPKTVDMSQRMPQQADQNNQAGLATLPALPLYVEAETLPPPAASEEAERTRRKRKAEGDGSQERPSKKLEVDERGVVIMMSGNTKLKERPTKIQSVVRKTLYGSMGVPELADAKDMPIYQEGMDPPDGSKQWKFGNLRFDWNATLRRSPHNVAMRDIVLKHIISLRTEYSEIPDSEFEPVRLEPAFDQAFGTWKGKYQGKRPGGIRRVAAGEKNSPKPNQNSQTEKAGQGEEEGAGLTLE
ncbi:hypothetical protein NliqN6_3169 [Naganishia liquefaciens]|uniref:Uncharacterized protein n=1 Tax=Naganishia liquefaciens TaxID=104408 RepID=A0A8H3TTB2_9TREE|nr:hypothetical protein NliqN6_3169 [Naganishia liquefaciens]